MVSGAAVVLEKEFEQKRAKNAKKRNWQSAEGGNALLLCALCDFCSNLFGIADRKSSISLKEWPSASIS